MSKIVILKCDVCGKENRIREMNLSTKEVQAANNKNGCYCSKCKPKYNKRIAYCILAGEFFTVYPKITSIEDIRGVNRAKEILRRGLEQLKE